MTNPALDVATVESCMVKTNAILVTLDLRATKRWKNSLCLLVMLYSIDSGIYALDESHVANIIVMACIAALGFSIVIIEYAIFPHTICDNNVCSYDHDLR
jgi:hypothetical protein